MKLILLAILAVVLSANNPTENEFEQYVGEKIAKSEVAKRLLSQDGGILKSIIEALDGVPCMLEQPFSPLYENYFVLSLYTIDLQCFSGPKVTLLGISGQIFPINAASLVTE